MPRGDAAIVDQQKLTGYCLNPEHPRGKHKARVFATLGFTVDNADELRTALLRAAATADAQLAEADQFGQRYVRVRDQRPSTRGTPQEHVDRPSRRDRTAIDELLRKVKGENSCIRHRGC